MVGVEDTILIHEFTTGVVLDALRASRQRHGVLLHRGRLECRSDPVGILIPIGRIAIGHLGHLFLSELGSLAIQLERFIVPLHILQTVDKLRKSRRA